MAILNARDKSRHSHESDSGSSTIPAVEKPLLKPMHWTIRLKSGLCVLEMRAARVVLMANWAKISPGSHRARPPPRSLRHPLSENPTITPLKMPSLRVPVPVFDDQIALRARFYQARAEAPKHAQVPTIIPRSESALLPRFPAVETLLGTETSVHDCWVTVAGERGRHHRFLVSCTIRPQITINYAIRARFPELPPWNGEIVVMAIGSRNRVVSLRGDAQLTLADAAVRTFVSRVQADFAAVEGLNLPFDVPSTIPTDI